MTLMGIPFDGLFIVYRDGKKLFHGFDMLDIPEEYDDAEIIRIYPDNNSIIIEIK